MMLNDMNYTDDTNGNNQNTGLKNYETFKEMTKLTILNMEHNSVIDIAPNSFSKMDILSDLDLSDNNLYEIKAQMFDGLKSLTKLNLEFNFIQKIDDKSFSELKILMKLDLSDNNLTEIGCFYFQGLIELINLDLNSPSVIKPASFCIFKNSLFMFIFLL